jgi:hypothetical protein
MSDLFEPREVERPFGLRWLKMALQLLVRCPLRFGVIVAALAWLDSSVEGLADGMSIRKMWVDWAALLLLPLLYTFVGAIARGADDPRQTWRAFSGFLGRRLWAGALGAGALMVSIQVAVLWLMQAYPELEYRNAPGHFLVSFETQTCVVCMDLGLCFFPLLAFASVVPASELRRVSRSAQALNGATEISRLLIIMLVPAAALDLVPSFGIGQAVWLVFMGTVSYVAYRDIFERRSGNVPTMEAGTPLHLLARPPRQRVTTGQLDCHSTGAS